jgi:hypothetical protein
MAINYICAHRLKLFALFVAETAKKRRRRRRRRKKKKVVTSSKWPLGAKVES